MTTPTPDRNPLRKVAATVTKVVGVVTALVTSLVGYGVVTTVQGDAVTGLAGLIPGLIAAIGTAVAAFQTAHRGEQDVTPLVDPRTDAGVPLVPDWDTPVAGPDDTTQ